MEVLIAIFILAIGLLGVAALLPVGGSEALEAVKADRAAAIGAAALRDVHVRKILEPFHWYSGSAGSTKRLVPLWYWQDQPQEDPEGTWPAVWLVIDPLGIAVARDAGTLSQWNYFPMGTTRMPRLTIRSLTTSLTTDPAPMSQQEAWTSFATTDGNYSWMIMLSPAAVGQSSISWRGCSVIVFYKRDLNPHDAGERVVSVKLDKLDNQNRRMAWFSPEGGGELVLDSSDSHLSAMLRPNHWLLVLSGQWCQWYRIVAAGKPDNPNLAPEDRPWHVTVAGFPWQSTALPEAVLLMEGVIGVYSQVVEVDLSRSRKLEVFGRK
jgi:hypothetical protein